MKSQYIADLRQGTEVRSCFFVRHARRSSGRGPHKFTLVDRTGEMPAAAWPNACAATWEQIESAQYADIGGSVEQNRYSRRLEVTVSAFSPAAEPLDLGDFIPASPYAAADLWPAVTELVNTIRSSALRRLLTRLFEDGEVRRGYMEAPAAQRMHHPYVGGLLEHSLEVARLCDAMSATMPELDRDLLVAAALLHDIGKIDEIDYRTPAFGYTRPGGMLGHVYLGAERVRAAMRNVPDAPDEIADSLCHLLLSSSRGRENGAPVSPCLLEAYVLSACDDLSAKRFYCRTAAADGDAALFARRYPLEGPVYTRCGMPGELGGAARGESSEFLSEPSSAYLAAPSAAGAQLDAANILSVQDEPALLPLLGRVAAGVPTAEQEDVVGYFPGAAGVRARDGDYLLRVRGDSMTGDHIVEDDLLHVRPVAAISHGDIVVALVDGESTVKRLLIQRRGAVLRASNSAYADIVADEEPAIQGRVVGVIRSTE